MKTQICSRVRNAPDILGPFGGVALLAMQKSALQWCYVVLGMLLLFSQTVRAGLTFEVNLYSRNGSYAFYTPMRTNGIPPDAPFGRYFVLSPGQPNNGAHREFEYSTNGFNTLGGGESLYNDFDSAKAQLEGEWTIVVTNATSTNTYKFTVTAPNLTSNLLPETIVTFPTQDQTGVSNRPTFIWEGPANWPVMGNATFYDDPFNFYSFGTVLPDDGEWTPDEAGPAGHANFYLQFRTNYTTSLINATTPLNTNSAQPLSGWTTVTTLESTAYVGFNVVSPSSGGSGGLANVLYYSFEDNSLFAHDFSGNENHVVTYARFSGGTNPYMITNDALAGIYSVGFTGSGWLSPRTNVVSALAASFSVSAWVRTTETHGNDNDDVFAAAGIFSAWNGNINSAVMPMGQTGSKLAFHTGGPGGNMLRSVTDINSGDYVHVVVTRDHVSGEKKIYVNGNLDASVLGSSGLLNGGADVDIGINNGQPFTGEMDEIQVYTGVLTAAEVTQLFQNPGTVIPSRGGSGHQLVAHHTFDEEFNEGADASGNGNDINCGGFWGDGHEFNTDSIAGDGALEFYGTSQLCISPPGQTYDSWQSVLGGSFTFSVWVKTTEEKGSDNSNPYFGATVIWAYNAADNANDTIPISLTGSKVGFLTRGDGGAAESLNSSPTIVNDGDYHHIVVTRDATTGEKKIYVDGNLEGSQFGTTDPLNSEDDLAIGGASYLIDGDGNFSSFIGLLDDVQMYSGVLSAQEVVELYENPGTTIPDTVDPGSALGEAVDAPALVWTTGGSATWFSQGSETHDGVDAAQSGAIGDSQETWIETTVNGPGTVSFWWNVSCQEIFFERASRGDVGAAGAFAIGDYLDFIMNGNVERSIYGEWGWDQETFKLPPGLHTLRWRYSKDPSGSEGADAGWVDEFVFDPNVEPEITFIPGDVAEFTGTNLSLTVQLYGFPEPTIRWFRNNVLLPEQTNATLTLPDAQPSVSGLYRMTASNHMGMDSTHDIRINIFDPTDLSPLSITAPSLAGSQSLVPISWVVTNTGPGYASNTVDQIYLVNTNGVFAFIGSMSRPFGNVVPPGGTYTLSNLFRLPFVSPGDYSIQVNLDVNVNVLELNETNNSLIASPITLINPDLQPGNLQAAPVGVGGLTFQITYNITNNGPGTLDGANWNDHIVLSTDNQWSDDDLNLVQPFQNPSIAVGQSVSRNYSFTLPVIQSGSYYLVVRLDRFGSFDHGSLWEVNETNNQAALAVQLTVPDLTPTNLVAPAQVSPSQPVNIQWSIQNIGDGVARAWNPAFFPQWYDRLYFSTNQVAGPGAVWTGDELGWNTPLPAGEFMTNNRTIEVPNLPEGDYFLVLTSDVGSRVREFNEDNNQLAVPIRVASPDLMPTTVTAPAVADAHHSVEISWAVTNRGAGLAQPIWRDRLYLSTNDTFEATDTLLGEFERSTVTLAGGTYSETNNVFLPGVAPGNYFLIFRADARTNLFESFTNNNFISQAINIASPDLVVTALDAPTNVASQQPFTVTFSVANVGATTAQPVWYERAFLSSDMVLDGFDWPVGAPNGQTFHFIHTTPLPVGNSYTQQVDLRIPSVPRGDYYLLFQTDGTNAFTEVNEGNNIFTHAIQVANPDLIPTNIIAPTSVTITQLHQRIEVGWRVLNQDTGTVQIAWGDRIYFSTNNILDAGDIHIGGQNNSLNLAFNQSYLAFDNPALPNGKQGQFYLLVQADGGGDIYESVETNNVLVSPLQIVIPPLPDLSVIEVTSPIEALSGQQIEITWVLTNRGTATAFGPFRDRVYLATTAAGLGAIEFGTFEFTGSIPPGGSVERIQRINLPIDLSGQRWVLVVADSGNELFEFDQEGNNSLITAQPINIILAPTPNLVVNSVTVPTETFSGVPMLVTWAVTNQGTGPTSSPLWYDAVYLSTDTNFGNDTFLGHAPNQAYLAPGEAYASGALVTIPRSLNGTHYIFVKSDYANYVFENLDENDNITMSGPVFINLTPPPDLRVGAINPPLNAFSGSGVQISYAITNYGLGQTLETAWWDRVYLSTNTTIDGNDHLIGSVQHVGGLEPGAGYRVTNSVGLPTGVIGDWYLLVRADAFNNVYEVPFEANNDGAPAFTTTIALTPPPDLVTTILSAPTNALASHALAVSYRVVNDGATITPTYHWTDRLYLSADTNFDAGTDLLVSYRNYSEGNLVPPGFPPPHASEYTRTVSGILPDGLSGTFYIFVRSDDNDAVFELDNANNIARASAPLTVISQPADLVVRSLTAPATAEAGGAMLVSWVVTNRSIGDTAVTRWYDRLVLSADDFIGDNDDVTLLTFQHDALLGGTNEYAVNNANVSIPIWLSAGEYRLYIVTDVSSDVYEGTNETNNVSALRPITIIRQTADLDVTTATAPASALSGGTLTATWRVENIGTRPANYGSWVDTVYLSTDEVLSPSDIRLGRRQNHSSPAPGGSYTNSLTASVPLGLNGSYFVIVQADEFNFVEESGSEANNLFVVSPAVSITPAPEPDLAVTEVNAPAIGYSGQLFEMSYTVQNLGTDKADSNWYDAVYLSLDHFLDPYVDTYLGFRARTTDLAVGASYTNQASFEIPQGFSGPFYVLVSTDVSGNVYEAGSETNNLSLDPQAMQVQLTPPVDLVAGPITVPANASPGVNATIAFTIYNYGSNIARGSWTDSLFISVDTNYDVGDALFGSVRHVGDVAAGSNYSAQLTAPLPGVLPGNYHVIVRSDILNHVFEDNNTNNAGASLDLVDIDSEVLVLGTPDNGLIAQGQSLYYKFNATAGDTVRVRFTTGIPLAGNEIYASYGAMPSRDEADFAASEPFIADPDLFIPIEHTGTHYLLVFSSAMPVESSYTILAEVLPFTVATAQPSIVGDRGSTTFKVRGALFNPETQFELINGTNVVTASQLVLEDSTTAFVTFNLVNLTNDFWTLKASMTETSMVTSALSNAVLVVAGSGSHPEVAINGPLEVWAVFTQPVLLLYGNSGDSDALAPLLIAEGIGGTLVGPDRDHLQSAPMQILGRSLDGPSDRLRPQTSFSHRMVYRGGDLHVRTRVMRADELRGITDEDWLEIESSVRPAGSDPVSWADFWANLRPRIGTTWGDYVSFLHVIAAGLPAEQRNVREMIGTIFTNEPAFRASSFISGVVLGSTNSLPQADVEVGFYTVDSNGVVQLGGSALTDAQGQFFVPFLQPGEYTCAIEGSVLFDFDMDRNGAADVSAPTFTLLNGSDLANQTLYLHQPAPSALATNDLDARLALDSHGVLHNFWYRDESLWHAWNDQGSWVDARPLTTNFTAGFAVGSSDRLVDGGVPGLIVVWSESDGDVVSLFYAVAQTNAGGYRWSLPVQLTQDLVENSSPAVVVNSNGLALITFLKRGLGFQDDTDVYFSLVDVSSGELLWQRPVSAEVSPASKLIEASKQNFSYSKTWTVKVLTPDDYVTIAVDFGGEFNTLECEANAKIKGSVAGTVNTKNFKVWVKGGGDITLNWNVDPDQCAWDFLEDATTGNVQLEFGFALKNAVIFVLSKIPQTAPFGKTLEEFKKGFESYSGYKMEDTLEFSAEGNLRGLHWKSAPLGGFGHPSIKSAELTGKAAVRFTMKRRNANDTSVTDKDGNTWWTHKKDSEEGGAQDRFTLSGGIEMALKGELYPKPKFKTLTFTPSLQVTIPTFFFPGGIKYSPNLSPQVIDLEHGRPAGRLEFLEGTLSYDPAAVIGTTNIYGTNSLLPDVSADVYDEGAPALALDAAGTPFQIWYRQRNPYDLTQIGSELVVADFDGSSWSAPAAIPGTIGLNGQVSAITDRLGRRLAVWVHGDTSGLGTNSTAAEFFDALRSSDVTYAVFDGATWSAPQPVAVTTDPDSHLQLSQLQNGDVLAVWTATDTNFIVRLLTSTWNGTMWSAPTQITSGRVQSPTAQQVGDTIYLLWTQAVDTNDNKGLFFSVNIGGTWGTPEAFLPKPAARSEAPKSKDEPPLLLAQRGAGSIIFGEIPDKCCDCKGKTTSVTNNPPTECGIALVKYDYKKCQKVYEFKACPRQSMDPNDIVGPEGFGPERWVAISTQLNYTIRFENDALLADAPAKEVIITLPLDPDFNPSYFRLGSFGFGDVTIAVPEGQAFYSTTLDLTEERGFFLNFFAGVDVAKGEAFWRLSTIDPATGFLPLDPQLGFLPPNVNSPEGEGFVNFSVRSRSGSVTGTRLDAKATIVFDTQPPIDTPPIFNSVDAGKPASAVFPLPASSLDPNFVVQWTALDNDGESGLAGVNVYVSEDGGDYFLWLPDTTLTQSPFVGEPGVEYSFYTVARDNAGNIEPTAGAPDATILIALPNTPPLVAAQTNRTIPALLPFTLPISATDTDAPPQTLTFELLEAPAGMTINTNTGLLSWTPTALQGDSTNAVLVRATDNGLPPLSANASFTVIVQPANSAPVFEPATNLLVHVQQLARTRVQAGDAETNAVTYSFGPGVPATATLDPDTGDFRWPVPLTAAGTTNVITVRATDDGEPSLTATQQFSVTVPHFVWLTLGETNLFTGQTSGVPVRVISSAPWRELSFELEIPSGTLSQLGLSNVVSPFTEASLSPLNAVRSLLAFSNAPSHELQGTQQLAQLTFEAVSPLSAAVPLAPQDFGATFAEGSPFLTTLISQGRVVIVADQPVLDALTLNSNRHFLRLYGNPGETYEIQTATNVTPPVFWLPFTELLLSNIVQTVDGDTNNVPFRVYRAVKQ